MQCGWGNGGGELGWWWRSLHALVHTHNPGWDTQPSFTHTHTHTNTNWPHTHTHYRYSCRQTRQTSCHTHLTETNRNSTLPYLLSFMELQMCSFIHSFSSLTFSFFRNSHMSPEVKHQSKLMISLGPPQKKKCCECNYLICCEQLVKTKVLWKAHQACMTPSLVLQSEWARWVSLRH